MNLFARLAFSLVAVSSMANATELVLPSYKNLVPAGTLMTASFESKIAMKGHRIGGPELLQVQGGLKCKIIATTKLSDDGAAGMPGERNSTGLPVARTIVGTVSPQVLVCDDGMKVINVAGIILPARVALGDQQQEQLEFIVAEPIGF